MSQKKDTTVYKALQCRQESLGNKPREETISLELIGEEPFLINIDEKPYSVVMRTPGEEIFHAAGFCLGEGIAGSSDDFKTIGYDKDLDPNIIDIWLTAERKEKIHDILERKIFVSQTSCGICGKEMVRDLYQKITPAKDSFTVEIGSIFDCINKLSENQNYYQSTRGSHAAIIFDSQLEKLSFAEDVGRHNALDKAIGKALMNRQLSKAKILVLSSRISYELIQKSARAQIPVMISNSRPTALAVEMGKRLNMTLAFPVKESELIIVCGKERIIRDKS
ncbi:MAG: formate dehydrogenase accessory sulfurtransferase FdhD [Deltaproteobacteria bacterium]|nr:formate dehydrogenase accessory sulfurtransferase FdhD [Deltaproteobacteria bacterium]